MPRSFYSRSGALLLALLIQTSVEVWGWCLESRQCQDLTTESNLLACIRACKPDLSAETPVFPGNGDEQTLTENPRKYVMGHFRWDRFGPRNSSGAAQQRRAEEEEEEEDAVAVEDARAEPGLREGKRSYSMEHFRWGKPVGKKRRPVKVYPSVAENESAEAFPLEFRRELAGERPDGLERVLEADAEKEDGPYRVERFRWGSPPKDKRYGGFMTSEKSQTPLVTLFKNAIVKNAHKKGQ
ncbi:pro-opiomelanocortin [Mesocricetus auratus]|uniref:Pro-opiomelanocortin n=1 Tax=Mesocricetus auratus TaxID=10036 RepID=A0A1U7R1K9_MESAU|nr:pro-opiomelanocortin [Mesocricetus auratus]XP_012975288.1 pro-opiomelanocortin [Mesocricetus auratus]